MSDVQLQIQGDWDAFCALESDIQHAETGGITARWECGRLLLGYEPMRGAKASPLGIAIKLLSGELDVSARELYNRRQFAQEYPDQQDLCNALQRFGSWYEIVKNGLGERAKRGEQETPPLPDGVYRTIVADPPWPMEKITRDVRPAQGVRKLDYPTMSLEQIGELPIADLAADDAHLYLWTTHRFLPAALTIAEAWGFNYQCVMTWVKNVGITPYSWMYDTEHVLFCKRGSLTLEQLGLRLSFSAPVTTHSTKPDIFYDRVLQASPGPRLELFARRPRDGFTVWGNEVAA